LDEKFVAISREGEKIECLIDLYGILLELAKLEAADNGKQSKLAAIR
jgi:hypothetical protein